jgi:hypothetical protein
LQKGVTVTDSIFCWIRVKGHLSHQWTDWFGDLLIENLPEGDAILSGPLPDQVALYGVLNRMRDLGLALISLECVEGNTIRKSDSRAGDIDEG